MSLIFYSFAGNTLIPEIIWKEYVEEKRTIQRKIDLYKVDIPKSKARKIIVLMDTTYWGRDFGAMLFKDVLTKENLLKYYVKLKLFFCM